MPRPPPQIRRTIAQTIGATDARRLASERQALTLLRLRRHIGEPDPGAPYAPHIYARVAGLLIRVIALTSETPDAVCRRLGITAARRQRLLKGQTNGGQWFRGHSPFEADRLGRPVSRRNRFDAATGEPVAGPAYRRKQQNLPAHGDAPSKATHRARRINGQRPNGHIAKR